MYILSLYAHCSAFGCSRNLTSVFVSTPLKETDDTVVVCSRLFYSTFFSQNICCHSVRFDYRFIRVNCFAKEQITKNLTRLVKSVKCFSLTCSTIP